MHRLVLTAKALVLCLTLAATLSCTNNTTITRAYIDPTAKGRNLQGVLVIGVAREEASRIAFEDAYAKALERHGVRAVASHTVLKDQDAKAEVLIATAEAADLDLILLTRYVGEKADDVYHPGTIYYDVMPAYGGAYNRGRFGGYYGHAYEVAYDQPVWSTNRTYTLISDLFAVDTRDHLWQVVSDTLKAGGDGKLRDDIIKGFVGNMKDEGLLD